MMRVVTAANTRIWLRVAVGAVWALMIASEVTTILLEQEFRAANRRDLVVAGPGLLIGFSLALAGAAIVGSVLALRRPRNPVGWLFLALALSLCWSGLTEAYGAYGAVYDPGSLPGARLAVVYSDGVFLPWVSILALILLLTPTGSAPSPRWKPIGWAAAASCLVFLVAITFRDRPVDNPPFEGITGPFSGNPFAGIANAVAFSMVVVSHLALLGAIVSVVVRVRRATGEERRQLRWLIVPAIPFPFLVAGAWLASLSSNHELLGVLAGGYLAVIPVAAGLAIEKQRLYDIDRIISRTVAYTLLTGLVVGTYVAIVVSVGIAGGTVGGSVPLAVIATLAAVALGGVTRRHVQDGVDRRFNRRSFAALEQVRRYVRTPAPGRTIEDALRDAVEDPSLSVAYWSDARAAWVAEDGTPASPTASAHHVQRPGGAPSAAIGFDRGHVPAGLLASLAAEARPELESARLRAAISLQLVEVRESRSRIVAAQLAERKRIERDLHDGSQQRLLALAMNLRATELSGDSEAALKTLPRAIEEIQATVRELRELANGLHPGVLEDGGLSAALQELAARAPVPIALDVLERRLPAGVESSAWFIACEAITNVVKHARAKSVSLSAREDGGMLILSIEDDGLGGADPQGHGVKGMADRAEAAGGRLSIRELADGGTSVCAVLPCA